jgi:site-specific DNA recombinase
MKERKEHIDQYSHIVPWEEKSEKVAIYIRVSTNEQAEDGRWVENQIEKTRKFIDLRKDHVSLAWEEYVFEDLWVSGADPWMTRAWLSKLFAELDYAKKTWQRMPFDKVVVYKIDRFARKLTVLLNIIDKLKSYWVQFASATEALDTSSPFGMAMLSIMWVFAELERSLIYERTSWWETLAKAWWNRWKWVYWYKVVAKRPVVYQEEAEIVKKIFEMLVYEQYSIGEIAKYLKDNKVLIPTASGYLKTWSIKETKYRDPYDWEDKTIRQILKNEVYIGKFYYHKTKRIEVDPVMNKKKTMNVPREDRMLSEVTHTPIINEEFLFDKAQEILENSPWKYQQANSDNMLTWLIKCWVCVDHRERGMLNWRWDKNGKVPTYECNWKDSKKHEYLCPCLSLPRDDLEDLVIDNVFLLLRNPKLLAEYDDFQNHNKKSLQKIKYEIDQTEKHIDKLKSSIEHKTKIIATEWFDDEMLNESVQTKIREQREDLKQVQEKHKELVLKYKSWVDLERYSLWFQTTQEIIGNRLEEMYQSKELTKKLIRQVVDNIIIYARDVQKWDHITWMKRKDGEKPMIPHKVEINFKLPQEFIKALYENTKQTWDQTEDRNRLSKTWSDYLIFTEHDAKQKKIWDSKTVKKVEKHFEENMPWYKEMVDEAKSWAEED